MRTPRQCGYGLALCLVVVGGSVAHPALGLVSSEPIEARIEIPDNIELARLIDLVSSALEVPLDYDPAVVSGLVGARVPGGLDAAGVWDLLVRTLTLRGLAVVGTGERHGFAVMPVGQAFSIAQVVPMASVKAPATQGPSYVVARYEPIHRSADVLVAGVGTDPTITIRSSADRKGILVGGFVPRVREVGEALAALDRPVEPVEVASLPVRHLPAAQVLAGVKELRTKQAAAAGSKVVGDISLSPSGRELTVVGPASEIAAWRTAVEIVDQPEPRSSRTYSATGLEAAALAELIRRLETEGVQAPWSISWHAQTSTVTVDAPASAHVRIAELVNQLSASTTEAPRVVRVFTVRNRPVEELAGVLERILSTIDDRERRERQQQIERAEVSASTQRPVPRRALADTDRISIVADAKTNAIIISATAGTVAQAERLMPVLDVRQPQVMLEVLIVSLSESQTFDLGVEIESLGVEGSVRRRLSSLFGLGTRGPGGDRAAGDGAGFTGLVLSPGDFSVLLRALQTVNNGRSLSMPRLLVTNNQQATLDSVLDQPFATTTVNSGGTTISLGGTQQAGTQITIRPQIAEGDHLLLEYSVSLSSFVGASSAPSVPPPRQQNRVQSSAQVPDGHVVALGGIEVQTSGRATAQVPGVGDVPILGEAFKNRSRNQGRSRFFVFIRANVMRSASFEDLKYISQTDANEASIDPGWPRTDPLVVRSE